jgi:hypothetical protein
MTGIYLHAQWLLTSQSRGSFLKENIFFVMDQTPRPIGSCSTWTLWKVSSDVRSELQVRSNVWPELRATDRRRFLGTKPPIWPLSGRASHFQLSRPPAITIRPISTTPHPLQRGPALPGGFFGQFFNSINSVPSGQCHVLPEKARLSGRHCQQFQGWPEADHTDPETPGRFKSNLFVSKQCLIHKEYYLLAYPMLASETEGKLTWANIFT